MNAQKNSRSRSPRFGPTMSQISGVTRPLLSHTNSFTGERMPTFGVETTNENALGTLLADIDTWGIDIFKISELSSLRPLTCIAYTVFQVKKYSQRRRHTKTCRFSNEYFCFISFSCTQITVQRFAIVSDDTTENIFSFHGHLRRSLCQRQSIS